MVTVFYLLLIWFSYLEFAFPWFMFALILDFTAKWLVDSWKQHIMAAAQAVDDTINNPTWWQQMQDGAFILDYLTELKRAALLDNKKEIDRQNGRYAAYKKVVGREPFFSEETLPQGMVESYHSVRESLNED